MQRTNPEFIALFKAYLGLLGVSEETLSESEEKALQDKLLNFIEEVDKSKTVEES